MGLDNYWVPPKNNMVVKDARCDNLSVWGGMMSGNGNGSFRGKVYAPIIEEWTEISLYEELDNAACLTVWARIKEVEWRDLSEDHKEQLTEKAFWDDFKTMWKIFAVEKGYGLHAWY